MIVHRPAGRVGPAVEGAQRFLPFAGWGAFVFVVLFWRLGVPSFWDPDEAHYAETTRELLASGDWLAPSYNEEPFFDKPILFHALQATAMAVFGATEFAARFVPALAALALVGVTAWLGATLVSMEVGVVGSLLLSASPGLFGLARYAILDTLFTLFVFGGAALVTVAALRDRPRLQYAGYVLIALAVLTKGPVALALCGGAFVLAIAMSADARRRLLGLRWIVGLALVVAISAPWFVYMWWRFGEAFIEGYVLNENVSLFAQPRYRGQPGPWFYFQVLAAGLLPWTGLVIGRLTDDVRRWWSQRDLPDTTEVLLWAWTAAVVGFFTLSQFKLDHYVFPVAPALCLLCARAWSDVRVRPLHWANAGANVGLHLVGPLLVAVGLGGGYFLIARLELPTAAIVVPAAVTLAGALVTARLNIWADGFPRVPWIVVAALGVTYVGLIVWVLPSLEQRKVVPDVAGWVVAHAGATDRVASYRLNRWSAAFRFYVDRHTAMLDAPDEAKAFFARAEPFYCVMLEPAYQEFVAQGVPLRVAYVREGMWATSGRVLWRRRIPPTRFVVVTTARDVAKAAR
jgi:4-amino-4-deoxy-L-arabinose transferase-like glycosyltransferase